jgi:hypothetical protein
VPDPLTVLSIVVFVVACAILVDLWRSRRERGNLPPPDVGVTRQPPPPEPDRAVRQTEYIVVERVPDAPIRPSAPPQPARPVRQTELTVVERVPDASAMHPSTQPEPVRPVSKPQKAMESLGEGAPLSERSTMDLKDLAHKLADFIWESEHSGLESAAASVFQYIQGVVGTELEYRRRMRDLDQRLAELESTRRGAR